MVRAEHASLSHPIDGCYRSKSDTRVFEAFRTWPKNRMSVCAVCVWISISKPRNVCNLCIHMQKEQHLKLWPFLQCQHFPMQDMAFTWGLHKTRSPTLWNSLGTKCLFVLGGSFDLICFLPQGWPANPTSGAATIAISAWAAAAIRAPTCLGWEGSGEVKGWAARIFWTTSGQFCIRRIEWCQGAWPTSTITIFYASFDDDRASLSSNAIWIHVWNFKITLGPRENTTSPSDKGLPFIPNKSCYYQ